MPLTGSVEIMITLGVADAIVDLVETGSTLAETRDAAEQARQAAMSVKGIQSVFSSVGGGSSGDAFVPGAAAEARRAEGYAAGHQQGHAAGQHPGGGVG